MIDRGLMKFFACHTHAFVAEKSKNRRILRDDRLNGSRSRGSRVHIGCSCTENVLWKFEHAHFKVFSIYSKKVYSRNTDMSCFAGWGPHFQVAVKSKTGFQLDECKHKEADGRTSSTHEFTCTQNTLFFCFGFQRSAERPGWHLLAVWR